VNPLDEYHIYDSYLIPVNTTEAELREMESVILTRAEVKARLSGYTVISGKVLRSLTKQNMEAFDWAGRVVAKFDTVHVELEVEGGL
jgi:hypothetical protein